VSCALAVVLASVVMIGRVGVEISAVHPALIEWVVFPLGAMMLTGIIASLFLMRMQGNQMAQAENVKFKNPFELGLAIKFGLLFALVLLVTKAANVYLGQAGVYVAAILAGTTDVDAITLSMSKLARDEQLSMAQAANGILAGTASNTAVKAGMAIVMGGWHFGRIVLAVFAIMLLAAVAAVMVRQMTY
jgi:uncharacterized membrane protein (DUF4010 family)